ncbi:SPOR domain-containing protein [bacterium]|nr:SPOR domain-containing protein [bacterium]
MQENNENYQEYKTYKRYKKEKESNTQSILTVFITTFLFMLVFFVGAAKKMTPNVDVSIGEDSVADAKESGLGVKGFIDNRLKSIQLDDVSNITKKIEEKTRSTFDEDDENEYYSRDLDERVKIPVIRSSKQDETSIKPENETNEKKETVAVKPTTAPIVKPSSYTETYQATSAPVSVKVVVGNYNTLEQAKIAQSILQEAGLGLTPFVKNIQGAYTLQVGSFNSESKAQVLVDELLRANFPARMIKN